MNPNQVYISIPRPKYKIGDIVEYFEDLKMRGQSEILIESEVMRIDEVHFRIAKRYTNAIQNAEYEITHLDWRLEVEVSYINKNGRGYVPEKNIKRIIAPTESCYDIKFPEVENVNS